MPDVGLITSRDICNQAVVNRILADNSVTSIKVAANLESDNYDGGTISSDSGTVGWRIERNTGDAAFNSITARGTVQSSNYTSGTGTSGWQVSDSGSAQFIGTLTVGSENVSTAQFFVDNELQHINIRENDDADYPDKIFIVDVNGGIGRLLWLDQTGAPAFTNNIGMHQDGTVDIPVGPLTVADGAVGTPSITFDNDQDTGFYRSAADQLSITVGGVELLRLTESTNDQVFLGVDGSASNPALAFTSETASGFYRVGSQDFGFSVNGTLTMNFDSGQTKFLDGSVSGPGLAFISDPDTGFYRSASDQLSLAAGGVELLRLTESTNDQVFIVQDGTTSVPALGFANETGTGLSNAGVAELSMITNGAERGRFHSNGLQVVNGALSTPSISFIDDTNTGLYSKAADQLGLVAGGVLMMTLAEGTNDQVLIDVDGSTANPGLAFTTNVGTGFRANGSNQMEISVNGTQEGLIGNTGIEWANMYDDTTTGTPNLIVTTGGRVRRDSSLEDFKEDIQPFTADGKVMELQPISYYGLAGNLRTGEFKRESDYRHLWFGARQAASVDERFVFDEGRNVNWKAIVAGLHAELKAALDRITALESAA